MFSFNPEKKMLVMKSVLSVKMSIFVLWNNLELKILKCIPHGKYCFHETFVSINYMCKLCVYRILVSVKFIPSWGWRSRSLSITSGWAGAVLTQGHTDGEFGGSVKQRTFSETVFWASLLSKESAGWRVKKALPLHIVGTSQMLLLTGI